MSSKLLLLVTQADLKSLIPFISDLAIPDWNERVMLLTFNENKSIRRRVGSDEFEGNTDLAIEKITAVRFGYCIANKHVALDFSRLSKLMPTLRKCGSLKILKEEVKDALRTLKLHWLDYAQDQWEHSSIQCMNPYEWCHQFSQLGINRKVGENLLKQLKVIPASHLQRSFTVKRGELTGMNVAHAYFEDDEPGSSSLMIRSVLEHIYPNESIIAISPDSFPAISNLSLNRIYIYEDGLWSGVELQKRLTGLSIYEAWKKVPLVFRYAVTSDAGLVVGRMHCALHGFNNVTIEPAENHFSFLENKSECDFLNIKKSDDLRTIIDSAIEPFVFKNRILWKNDLESGRKIMESLGKQLILPFLRRREQAKQQKSGKIVQPLEDIVIRNEKINKWSLGSLKFGSTIVFSSSIPKSVLPIFWLKGQVKWGSAVLIWRPLFWDVRLTDEVQYKTD
ncbi:phosphoribosyltransferase-like protein [Herbaspirillum sp. CF444]|uniref:phosphoribosyltransferase-like protein n=1 Tax=Herbaspirillum sp. CF444 TaxID=1144319 RepID=UPI00031195AE|nr:hypothetical protein [Herbaspirillum sp. CF444]